MSSYRDHRTHPTMMRPAHHSHHISEDASLYSSIQNAVSSPPYPSFAASLQNVDPAIEHAISGFNSNHGHGDGHRHAHGTHAPSHQHVQNNGFQLGSNIPASLVTPGRQHGIETLASSQRHQFNDHSSKPTPRTASPGATTDVLEVASSEHFDMLPPPNSTHSTWHALHEFAQTHASSHGYALSINTTAKNRSRIKLACVCYGAPKNTHKLTPETRVRKNRVSYKTGCRMWVEGKKQEDGTWLLRVGEPTHNHLGRSVEGWASQRKRTWGVQGGRVGVGGVTAKEEQRRTGIIGPDDATNGDEALQHVEVVDGDQGNPSHSLESGGLVWKIVEQEMMRKSDTQQGRDRGVGRTVKVLEERLPGIHIFKRDVYNIRAQIKRARKAAGQEIGEGLSDTEELEAVPTVGHEQGPAAQKSRDNTGDDNHADAPLPRGFPEIDPILVAQCNDALKNVTQQEESEVDRLRKEVEELRQALARRTKEVEERNSENESLRVQVELAHMALGNDRGHTH